VPVETLQLGRSVRAAIAITGLSAYSNGFEFAMTALLHPGDPGFDAETRMAAYSPTSPTRSACSSPMGARSPAADHTVTPSRQDRSCGHAAAAPRTTSIPVVGLAAATKRAAGVHLPLAGTRDRRNEGQHRRATHS
jgi:hypothetical protein